jgi:Uma2 family endonuclease
MSTDRVQSMTVAEYERAADEYESTLTLEDVMEGEAQATQREITLESLALLRDRRPEVRVYNELLVQYFHEGQLRQVVPDNMIALSDRPLVTRKSYTIEYDPPPLLVLEWVSDASKNKDYKVSFQKYEQHLQVPYALFFHPDQQDLRVYRHAGPRYEVIPANAAGRHLILELELEVALQDGWVRYWFRGKFLELPGALQHAIDEVTVRAELAEQQARQERERAEQAERLAQQARERAEQSEQELARLRALLAAQSGGPPPAT